MQQKKTKISVAAILALIATQGYAQAPARCAPVPPAPCYSVDTCEPTFCLGPDLVNPAVNPKTCDGDLDITVAGFYWIAQQDGMEYAVNNSVMLDPNATPFTTLPLNNLVNATYLTPHFKWNFGFKAGLAYSSNHDGWDIGVLWTWYEGRAADLVEQLNADGGDLVTLWSAYASSLGEITHCNRIDSHWKLKMNLVDVELGREMWMSKYLTLRPFIGVRLGWLDQDFNLVQSDSVFRVDGVNNFVKLDNNFRGVGVRSGFNTVWNFGRGFGFYGDFALSILYGRFRISHKEHNELSTGTFETTKVLETSEGFNASRAVMDLGLGVEYQTLFSECRYGFTAKLGWEQHLFFSQNQMWRVVRIGDQAHATPNDTGENVFHQRRGDLSTEGVTLTLKVAF